MLLLSLHSPRTDWTQPWYMWEKSLWLKWSNDSLPQAPLARCWVIVIAYLQVTIFFFGFVFWEKFINAHSLSLYVQGVLATDMFLTIVRFLMSFILYFYLNYIWTPLLCQPCQPSCFVCPFVVFSPVLCYFYYSCTEELDNAPNRNDLGFMSYFAIVDIKFCYLDM